MLGRVLDSIFMVCSFGVLFHPTVNIFSVQRYFVYPLLLIFLLGRLLLNQRKFSTLTSIGNVLVLGGFTAFLFILTDISFWGIKYMAGTGWLLNWLAIFANQGRMPVEKSAFLRRKREVSSDHPLYFVEQGNTRFKILDDRIYILTISTRVLSIGDVLIRIGTVLTSVQIYLI